MSPKLLFIIVRNAFFVICVLAFSNCKKSKTIEPTVEEPVAQTPQLQFSTALTIDSNNTNLNITKFPGAKLLHSTFGVTKFPFDIDGDAKPDIEFSHEHAYGGFGTYTSTVKLATVNNSVTVLTDSIFTMAVSGGTLAFQPKTVYQAYCKYNKYADTLKLSGKWRSGDFTVFEYHEYWVGAPGNNHLENTYSNFQTSFIGVRINNKLGWLKVVNYLNMSLLVYEIALEK